MLGLSQEALADASGLSSSEIGRLEKRGTKLVPRSAYKLKAEIEKLGVEFLEATDTLGFGIRWKNPGRVDPFHASQIRAGRMILGISQAALAERARVDRSFIVRLENEKPKSLDPETVQRVLSSLVAEGIELTPQTGTYGVGVRMRLSSQPEQFDPV
jgi:transcriptional regulator with XRE-family HTH domain